MQITLDTEQGTLPFARSTTDAGEAVYIVAFQRYDGDDFNDGHTTPGPVDDNFGWIKQLHDELQEAYDVAGIAGNFKVVGRVYNGEFTTTENAMRERFNITVKNAKGEDITHSLANAENIDGNRVKYEGAPLGSAGPIGSLRGLRRDEAGTCIAQIIDTGREWGPTDDEAELLYKLIGPILERGAGHIATPDGWTISITKGAPA